jgi:hypothetical protein
MKCTYPATFMLALSATLLFLAGTTVSSRQTQVEHAPTVEQCQADQRLWLSQLESTGPLPDVPFRTLNAWMKEMNQCQHVDLKNSFQYLNTISEANSESRNRLEHFLDRHNLYEQFLKEDDEGKR